MSTWSENYHFIKEVYDFRVEEMNKWMDALEESSKKLITNKVYTSREFRRMRDQFRYQCKNLKREDMKLWLHEMLKLLNQKSDQNLEVEKKRLEALIQRHAEMLPGIEENMRKVDVYSRCYQYVDDITPLLKLLQDLRRKSTEDEYHDKKGGLGAPKGYLSNPSEPIEETPTTLETINVTDKQGDAAAVKIHPDSTDQVASFIEAQEANINKIDERRGEFAQLLKRGEKLENQADCPDFLKEQVKGFNDLFHDTEKKARAKLATLKDNEKAWQEYEEDRVQMGSLLDQADERLRNIRELYDPKSGAEDLAMRVDVATKTRQQNEACFNKLKGNVTIIGNICSADKKEELDRIMSGFADRIKVLDTMDEKITGLTKYTRDLQTFVDKKQASLKWLQTGEEELVELMKFPGEDKSDEKLLMTVKSQKDMESQMNILAELISESERMLGGKENSVAESHIRDVDRVKETLEELNNKLKDVSGEISEDLHHWADYQAELKAFQPWIGEAEKRIEEGLKKPSSLSEAQEMLKSVQTFDEGIRVRLANLDNMGETVGKMTQHDKADKEIEECRKRREASEKISAEWVGKAEKLVKQWEELNQTVTEVQNWVAASEMIGELPTQDTVDFTLNKLKGYFAEKQKLVEAL